MTDLRCSVGLYQCGLWDRRSQEIKGDEMCMLILCPTAEVQGTSDVQRSMHCVSVCTCMQQLGMEKKESREP